MNPANPLAARVSAGKMVINSLQSLMSEGKSFAIESTLSGKFLEKHIALLKDNGYEVNLTYICLGNKDLCMERIKSRVRQGGHHVPDQDVTRRFDRSLEHFWYSYKELVDYYNTMISSLLPMVGLIK